MSKIVRKFQKIFGGNIPALNNISQFGSLKNGTPNFSLDPDVIQGLPAWENGWSGATVNNAAPPLQDVNATSYIHSYGVAYLHQMGIAEWDSQTTYFIGSFVSDGAETVYMSVANDNVNNLLTDQLYWVNFKSIKIASISASRNITNTDWIVVGTGPSALTVTLPLADKNKGRKICIKSSLTSGSLITVNVISSGTIDGNASVTLTRYQSMFFTSDGSEWLSLNYLPEASTTIPGIMTIGAQQIGGIKTFVNSLVPTSGIKGRIDGVSPVAGDIGERRTVAFSGSSLGASITNLGALTNITNGTYIVRVMIYVSMQSGGQYFNISLSHTGSMDNTKYGDTYWQSSPQTSSGVLTSSHGVTFLNVASTISTLNLLISPSAPTNDYSGTYEIMRIA